MPFQPFIRKKIKRRVFVIGLDCAAPELVFERWRDRLPHLDSLMRQGVYGDLWSVIPAITVPAWSSMLTSKDPGTLGFYGFRNRKDYSYDQMSMANGTAVREKRIWHVLGNEGYDTVAIGIPQTYPVRPIKGHLISGFLTPNTGCEFTYPPGLKNEVLKLEHDYVFDVKEFRTDDKDHLLDQIVRMTQSHFKVIDHMLRSKPWDLFMFVEIGVDRIHHAFWHYQDESHIQYEGKSPYRNAIFNYYKMIDQKIGEWLEQVGEDTVVLVVSDHGAKRMDGGLCINEWLWRNGYLVFKQDPIPGQVRKFEEMEVDWPKTRAWGSGGYYGRIFINVKDREPFGSVPKKEYSQFQDRLANELVAIPGPDGNALRTKVFKPQDVYRQVKNIPPDLIVYFDDLYWRSVGSLGYEGYITFENDTGPDSCNHAENGLFIIRDPQSSPNDLRLENVSILDIAPTIIRKMGCRIPRDMQGSIISC